MKIIAEDENLMVLKDRNIIAFVIGTIFFLFGIAAIFQPDFFTNQPPLPWSFAAILLGVITVAVAKITTVKLDKSIGKLTFFQKGLMSQNSNEYDLKKIKEVELNVTYHHGKNGGYSFHLAFVFDSGEIVQLNPFSSSIVKAIGQQINPEKKLGTRIAAFLGVPFQERRPLSVNEALSAVSSAIKQASEEMEKRKKL